MVEYIVIFLLIKFKKATKEECSRKSLYSESSYLFPRAFDDHLP